MERREREKWERDEKKRREEVERREREKRERDEEKRREEVERREREWEKEKRGSG